MGTLQNQKPRYDRGVLKHWNSRTERMEICDNALELVEEKGITFEQAMMVFAEERKSQDSEYMRHDLDVKDEQLAGFGELLSYLTDAIREGFEKLEDATLQTA